PERLLVAPSLVGTHWARMPRTIANRRVAPGQNRTGRSLSRGTARRDVRLERLMYGHKRTPTDNDGERFECRGASTRVATHSSSLSAYDPRPARYACAE